LRELSLKLMYTHSPEIGPILVTAASEAPSQLSSDWAVEALWGYLPHTEET